MGAVGQQRRVEPSEHALRHRRVAHRQAPNLAPSVVDHGQSPAEQVLIAGGADDVDGRLEVDLLRRVDETRRRRRAIDRHRCVDDDRSAGAGAAVGDGHLGAAPADAGDSAVRHREDIRVGGGPGAGLQDVPTAPVGVVGRRRELERAADEHLRVDRVEQDPVEIHRRWQGRLLGHGRLGFTGERSAGHRQADVVARLHRRPRRRVLSHHRARWHGLRGLAHDLPDAQILCVQDRAGGRLRLADDVGQGDGPAHLDRVGTRHLATGGVLDRDDDPVDAGLALLGRPRQRADDRVYGQADAVLAEDGDVELAGVVVPTGAVGGAEVQARGARGNDHLLLDPGGRLAVADEERLTDLRCQDGVALSLRRAEVEGLRWLGGVRPVVGEEDAHQGVGRRGDVRDAMHRSAAAAEHPVAVCRSRGDTAPEVDAAGGLEGQRLSGHQPAGDQHGRVIGGAVAGQGRPVWHPRKPRV